MSCDTATLQTTIVGTPDIAANSPIRYQLLHLVGLARRPAGHGSLALSSGLHSRISIRKYLVLYYVKFRTVVYVETTNTALPGPIDGGVTRVHNNE